MHNFQESSRPVYQGSFVDKGNLSDRRLNDERERRRAAGRKQE